MKKIKSFAALAVCVITCLLFAGCGEASSDMTAVIKTQYSTVVSLSCSFEGSPTLSNGSGVLIVQGGYIATNYHVVVQNGKVAKTITVTHWSDDHYNGTFERGDSKFTHKITEIIEGTSLLYKNSEEDLAIIKCTNSDCDDDANGEYGKLAAVLRTTPVVIGEAVFSMGSSFGYMFRCSIGVVSQTLSVFNADVDGVTKSIKNAIFHDAVIINGNSGGPVFDKQGRLIGLNTLINLTETKQSDGSTVTTPAFGFSIALSSGTILEAMKTAGLIF